MKGSLVPCGHTFSDFQIYDEKTAKEECIKMVRNIMEYWINRSKPRYANSIRYRIVAWLLS